MPRQDYIKFRRGTAAQWTSEDPTLGPGEPGFETDTNKIKIGDGSTAWTSLDYLVASGLTNNYTATSAPTTGDDSDDNYSVGSVWVDVTNDNSYICLDASLGAAVWEQTNGGGSPTASSGTGTAITLNIVGAFYNTATPSTSTTYTISGTPALGEWAKARSSSSTASEPVVTGATNEGGVEWESGVEYDIFIIKDDEGLKYSFIPTDTTFAVREVLMFACSNEDDALTTGTKLTFRMPFAMTLTDVRASLTSAGSTSGTTTIDINEGGVSILSTLLTIDFGEKTSTTAATPVVISDSALAEDAEITVDVDAVTGGADETGLKVTLIGYRS